MFVCVFSGAILRFHFLSDLVTMQLFFRLIQSDRSFPCRSAGIRLANLKEILTKFRFWIVSVGQKCDNKPKNERKTGVNVAD